MRSYSLVKPRHDHAQARTEINATRQQDAKGCYEHSRLSPSATVATRALQL